MLMTCVLWVVSVSLSTCRVPLRVECTVSIASRRSVDLIRCMWYLVALLELGLHLERSRNRMQ